MESKLLAATSEKISCLQEAMSLLNQCISEQNQGWLQNDQELKTMSCLWRFELRFWTYGWIRLIDLSAPIIVSRPQTPRSRIFWDFIIVLDSSHDFWENEVLFVKSGAMVLDLWLDTSSWHKWPKCSF